MTQQRLMRYLREVGERQRVLVLRSGQAVNSLAVAALAGLCWFAAHYGLGPGAAAWPWLAGLGALGVVATRWWASTAGRDPAWLARRIEARHPELDGRLLAAVTLLNPKTARAGTSVLAPSQDPSAPTLHATRGQGNSEGGNDSRLPDRAGERGRLPARHSYLEEQLLTETVEQAGRRSWTDSIPSSRLAMAGLANVGSLAIALFALVGLARFTPSTPERGNWPWNLQPVARGVTVEPGDTEIERGAGLLVLARFDESLPSDVWLVYEPAEGTARRMRLAKSLDDPVFGGRLDDVAASGRYRIEYDAARTRDYQVRVFEYPQLVKADARLDYPEYTGQPARTIEDTRTVTGVEGTALQWRFTLNKPIAQAVLVAADGARVDVEADAEEPSRTRAGWKLSASERYELELTDAEGRKNKDPIQLVVNVVPNRPPELKLAHPSGDQRVSPLEELEIEASAFDDFRLEAAGLQFSIDGGKPREVALAEQLPGGEKQKLVHMLALEKLDARPDQLITFAFWADDIGPDGQRRRAFGEMYFAEVRPFDEAFREGEQPAGGEQSGQQGGGGGESEELVRLQKEVISATWNLIRREQSAASAKFTDDLNTVADAQQHLIGKAEDALGKLPHGEELSDTLRGAIEQMRTAADHLQQAAKTGAPDLLTPALAAEQAAYQALLKLRAREHQVTRGRQGGGGGGGGGVSQQQLNELELKEDENRYETRREAQAEQSAADREQNEVLDRLRDLARRQQDVTEQLKELQAQLAAAETQDEREELQRRLQRLREEQQELLRDVDQLQSRLDQPENQSRWADERRELRQTREQVRQASESLEQGMVGEAVSSGTRAGRQLQQLREQMRRQSASRFQEQMQELRSQARELSARQEALDQQLRDERTEARKTLRDSEEQPSLSTGLSEQKERLNQLLEEMRRVTEESEASEPLLSRQLYDTIRQAKQAELDRDLEAAAELAERGFPREADDFLQRAGRGVDQLRQGVEQAAESVLGDEAEALRRAREQLDELAQRLEREIQAHAPGENGTAEQDGEQASANAGSPTGQPGEPTPSRSRGQRPPDEAAENELAETQPGNSDRPSGERSRQGADSQAASGRSQSQPSAELPNTPQQGQSGGQASENSPSPSVTAQSPAGGEAQGDTAAQADGPRTATPGTPGGDQSRQGGRGGESSRAQSLADAMQEFLAPGGPASGPADPLTGEGFLDWSEGLRDVEQMLSDPKLQADVARILDRARSVRSEFKRHAREPEWDLVRQLVAQPLVELRDKVAEELARRDRKQTEVPLDRDPVPRQFAEQVQEYYERLGSGQ